MARENGTTVKGFLELRGQNNSQRQETRQEDAKQKNEREEYSQEQEEREEDTQKQEGKEDNAQEKEDKENTTQEQEDREEKTEEQDKKEEDKEDDTHDYDDNDTKKNKFKEDLNMKYFTDRGINVNMIESALRNSNVDLTPKQLLLFIGTLRLKSTQKQQFSSKEELKEETKRIYNEIRNGEFKEADKSEQYYMQTGAHVFYDMYQGKTPKDAGEIFAHAIAVEYIKEEQKMSQKDENEMQKDEATMDRGA